MIAIFQDKRRLGRFGLAGMLMLSFLFNSLGQAVAGTVGTISGHVTGEQKAPLANVRVAAASASGTQTAVTDSHGFYSLIGLTPDTYTVSFQLNGYQPQSFPGITVFADQNVTQDTALVKSLKTIAQVHSRGAGGAFQPNQTTDTYAVTAKQIQNIQGTVLNDDADQLLKSMPGASSSTNRLGAVIVRGGRANAIGYSFGGMSLVNSYNNQISVLNQGNVPNSASAQIDRGNILPTIGISQVTLTPGVADASFSSTGTGNFNIIPKTGTFPGFSDAVVGIGGGHYRHLLALDYGIASTDGHWNEYAAFQGSNMYPNYGNGLTCQEANSCNMQSNAADRTFMNNLSYHFGRNNQYGLNFLYLNQYALTDYDYGITTNGMCFRTCDNNFVGNSSAWRCAPNYTPYDPTNPCAQNQILIGGSEFGSHLFTIDEMQHIMGYENNAQTSYYETLAQAGVPFWGTGQYRYGTKLEFTDRINSTTYLQARTYSAQSAQYSEWYQNGIYDDSLGPIHDIGIDLNKQLGEHHFLKAGVDSQFEHPVHTFTRTTWGPEITMFNNNTEIFDFVNPSGYCGASYYMARYFMGMNTAQSVNYAATNNPGYCGYLYKYFNSSAPALQAPSDSAFSDATRWTGGYYVTDRWTPNDRFAVDYGLRLDQANYHYPAPSLDPATCTSPYLPTSYVLPTDANGNPVSIVPGSVCPKEAFADIGAANRPHILQPRVLALYKLSPSDVVRASYGRSFSWAPQSEVGTAYNLNKIGPYSNVPAYGNPAMYCLSYGNGSGANGNPANGPCNQSTGLPNNPGQSVPFYNALWPFPCPLGMTLAQCQQWNPNYPYAPAGQANPTGPATACGFAPYYVPCANYQEQLNYEFWNDLNYKAEPGGINPMVPSTFINYDVSYEHEFANGVGPRWLRDFTQGTGVKLTAWSRRGYNLQATASLPGAPDVIGAYGAALYGGLLNPNVVGGEYANIFANGYSMQTYPNGSYGIGREWDNGLELQLTRERDYGLSLYYGATYNHTVSNLPSDRNALAGTVPGASLFLNELYPEGFVPKFTATFVPSFRTHNGWRFAAQVFYNAGFPMGSGLMTPAYLGGCLNTVSGGFNPNTPCAQQSAVNANVYLIPNTNLANQLGGSFGSTIGAGATQFVDPLDPGSYLHPNIAATTGTKEGRYLNSATSPPASILNFQIEKELSSKLTLGFNVDNVAGETAFGPELNDRYQVVATGVSGPLTGTTGCAYAPPGQKASCINYGSASHGTSPYVNFPRLEGRTFYIYLSIKNL